MSEPAVYLAFDFGTKKIGVAVGQDLTRNARPLTTLTSRNGNPDWPRLDQLIRQWAPRAVVVGLPLAQGESTTMSERARRFGQSLSSRYNLPVYWVDETLTSVAAQQRLAAEEPGRRRRQQQRDQLAACMILETFFNLPPDHADGTAARR